MIDSANETLISLADVPGHLPHRRGGRRAARLVHLSLGAAWRARRPPRDPASRRDQMHISRRLQRFFERLSAPGNGAAAQIRTPLKRQRAAKRALRTS